MSTETPSENSKDTSGTYLVVGVLVLGAIVGALAISPGTRPLAIAAGTIVPAVIGVIAFLVGAIDAFSKRDKSTGDQDFSSFPGREEGAFVVHEKAMRGNSHTAGLIGWGSAGAGFLIGAAIVAGLYSPCYQFCQRPAGDCDEAKAAEFRRSCEASCSKLEATSGLQVLRPTGEGKKMTMMPVSGTEYVQALAGCSFANGAGAMCEEIVPRATSMGLWCPEKK